MRHYLIFLGLILAGCGSSRKDSTPPAPATPPEITRLDISDSPGAMTISGTYALGSVIEDPYDLVVSLAEGATAPDKCDKNSKEGIVLQFTGLKAATLYSLRGCIFKSTDATYSTGITVQHTAQ